MAPCPAWHDSETEEKLYDVVRGMRDVTRFIQRRAASEVLHQGHLKNWHFDIFSKVVPLSYYAGNFRREDPSRPCLGTPVWIGGVQGLDHKLVVDEMKKFSNETGARIKETDEYIALKPTHTNVVRAVLQLAAWAVGRFVQIHPFVNGNGRISRMMAGYFFARYGFPLPYNFDSFPRPKGDYAAAMASCMSGNFNDLYQYFLILFANRALR